VTGTYPPCFNAQTEALLSDEIVTPGKRFDLIERKKK